MPIPDNCPEHVYELMLKCWEENPQNRPDFTTIRRKIEKLIGDENVMYLNLDTTGGTVQYSELGLSENGEYPLIN